MTTLTAEDHRDVRTEEPDGTGDWRPWSFDMRRGPRALAAASPIIWRVLASISVLGAVVLHAVMASFAFAPVFPFDEVTLLLFSADFAGMDVDSIRGAGYFPGWSLLMAPIWLFTDDPRTMYRSAIWLGAMIGVATIWPLSRVAARFGLTTAQSLTVAGVVMALPARTVQVGNVMSEKPLFLLLTLVMLCAMRAWEKPTMLRTALLSLMVAGTLAMHARALVVVIACAVWLALLMIRSWKAGLVGLAALAAFAYPAYKWGYWVNEQLLAGKFRDSEGLLDNLVDERPSIVLRALLGQLWTQTVGSGGLFVVGGVVMLCLVFAELRRGGVGPMGLLAAMTTGIMIISVATWAREEALYLAGWRRLDAWLYGRYIDPQTSLIVTVGLAALVRRLHARAQAVAAVLGIGLIVVVIAWVVPHAPTWAWVTPAHMPGLMPWRFLLPGEGWPEPLVPTLTNANRFWLHASIPTVLLLCLPLLRRLRGTAVVALLAVFAIVGSAFSVESNRFFQYLEGSVPSVASEARQVLEEHEGNLYFDMDCYQRGVNAAVLHNKTAFWTLPHATIAARDPGSVQDDRMMIITCTSDPFGAEDGAQRLGEVEWDRYGIWVQPGPLQDELREEGLLAQEAVPVG